MMEPGLGVIEQGAPADLIAVDTGAPHLWPTQNLVHTLVESASGADVRHSIVNGKLLMRRPEAGAWAARPFRSWRRDSGPPGPAAGP